jgi:hypothetical protein
MTTQSIITDIRKRLLELSTGVFSDSDLITWMNLTQTKLSNEILDQNRIKKTTLAFTSGIASLPSDFISFYFAKDYEWVTIEDFENDTFENMLCRQESNIYIKPTNIISLNIYYYRKPLDLSILTPTVEPELPTVLHEAIILGAMIRAFEAMQEIELSNAYMNKYQLLVNEAKQAISILEERFKGKPLFNYTKLI